jgi:hypothetical protein
MAVAVCDKLPHDHLQAILFITVLLPNTTNVQVANSSQDNIIITQKKQKDKNICPKQVFSSPHMKKPRKFS